MYRQIRLSVKPIPEQSRRINSILIPRHNPESLERPMTNSTCTDVYTWLATHPDGPCGWDTVIDRESIEEHLLHYNKASFRAASASPCGHGKVLDDLTFSTLSKAGTDLLHGEFPTEWHSNNDLLREFFASFTLPDSIRASNSIPTSVEEADVKRGFGKWREATSTSPSGRHLGHYRALIQDDILLSCLTKFLDIVVQRGISLSRWQHAINVMLREGCWLPSHKSTTHNPSVRGGL
jgi:hypothetical protein